MASQMWAFLILPLRFPIGEMGSAFCCVCPSHPKTLGQKPGIQAQPDRCPSQPGLPLPLADRGPALLRPLHCQSMESAPILGRAMNFSSKACRLWETYN